MRNDHTFFLFNRNERRKKSLHELAYAVYAFQNSKNIYLFCKYRKTKQNLFTIWRYAWIYNLNFCFFHFFRSSVRTSFWSIQTEKWIPINMMCICEWNTIAHCEFEVRPQSEVTICENYYVKKSGKNCTNERKITAQRENCEQQENRKCNTNDVKFPQNAKFYTRILAHFRRTNNIKLQNSISFMVSHEHTQRHTLHFCLFAFSSIPFHIYRVQSTYE